MYHSVTSVNEMNRRILDGETSHYYQHVTYPLVDSFDERKLDTTIDEDELQKRVY